MITFIVGVLIFVLLHTVYSLVSVFKYSNLKNLGIPCERSGLT